MVRFDLNLIRTLVAIHETRSVTLAAERLELTQSTTSHALSRLRNVYADHLFVRHPKGLEPTSLATQLYDRFSQMLAEIDSTLEPRGAFEPMHTTRRFRLAMSDMGMLAFGTGLLQGLTEAAPHSEIEIAAIGDSAFEDLVVGRTDALIGNLPALAPVTRSRLLFREHYLCMLSAQHPTIGTTLSLKQFAAARHVMLLTPTPGNQVIDTALGEHRLTRTIAVRSPHLLDLANLIAESQFLVVLPARVAKVHIQQRHDLRTLPLPIALPEFEMRVYWHNRNAGHPAHQWLIETISTLLGQAP